MTAPPPPAGDTCPSCGAARPGQHCPDCGERRIDPARDHSLRWLFGHVLDGWLQLDGKLLRALRALLFAPGRLTRDHLDGRRVPYLPPLHLFLTTGVVFYLFFQNAYAAPIDSLQQNYDNGSWIGNVFRCDFGPLLAHKAEALHGGIDVVKAQITVRAAQESKVFLGALVPVFALWLQLLYWRRQPRFVPHFVTGVHFLTAFLLIDMLFLTIMRLLDHTSVSDLQFLPLFAVFLVHVVVALRRIHREPWPLAAAKGIAFVAGCVVAIVIYRQAVTITVARLL
ncbi:MAG: DUF3667 domain-containing protein [Planctomycetota bacterium]